MSRYIDEISARENFQDVLAYMGSEVKRMLKKIPTADVVEVRHGAWLKTNSRLVEMTCSLCGFTYYGEHDVECMSAFCPECGAKMDGERSTKDET